MDIIRQIERFFELFVFELVEKFSENVYKQIVNVRIFQYLLIDVNVVMTSSIPVEEASETVKKYL